MGHDRFQQLRSNLQFVPPVQPGVETAALAHNRDNDPLWGCRILLSLFLHRCVSIEVPTGSVALDENSKRCKARSREVSYIKSKPDKYAVRFYAVVGHKYQYVFNFFDNLRGHRTDVPPVMIYCQNFPNLRESVRHICHEDSTLTVDKPSALWLSQCGHLVSIQPATVKTGKNPIRWVFCDNFYTRHPLAHKIIAMTNTEVHIIGTVRMNYIDKLFNRPIVEAGIKSLAGDNRRGDWVLVPEYELPLPVGKSRKNKTKDTAQKAKNCGFIIWRDTQHGNFLHEPSS